MLRNETQLVTVSWSELEMFCQDISIKMMGEWPSTVRINLSEPDNIIPSIMLANIFGAEVSTEKGFVFSVVGNEKSDAAIFDILHDNPTQKELQIPLIRKIQLSTDEAPPIISLPWK